MMKSYSIAEDKYTDIKLTDSHVIMPGRTVPLDFALMYPSGMLP